MANGPKCRVSQGVRRRRGAWLAKIGRRGNGTGTMGDEDWAALPAALMRLGSLR
jgi:hypothetical protein